MIPCPPCQWPTVLDERGPPDDPSILLTGTARIGDAILQLVAIRMDPALRWAPDYRPDVAAAGYAVDCLDEILETTLEELDYLAERFDGLLGESGHSVVTLAGRPYRLWLRSSSGE